MGKVSRIENQGEAHGANRRRAPTVYRSTAATPRTDPAIGPFGHDGYDEEAHLRQLDAEAYEDRLQEAAARAEAGEDLPQRRTELTEGAPRKERRQTQPPVRPLAKVGVTDQHVYTFDPRNAARTVCFTEYKDANGNVKKRRIGLKKLEVAELVRKLGAPGTAWHGILRYNELDRRIYATRPPFRMSAEAGTGRLSDEDITAVRVWLEVKENSTGKKEDIASALHLQADGCAYHPIRDWLNSLKRGTTRHLDTLAAELFGDDRPIAQKYLRKQMIASVARIFEPGAKVDTVLVLVGPDGGEKKSTVIERLYCVPGCNVFRSDLPDIRDNQKVGQALDGVWVVEIAELACVRKADVETVKSFLTRRDERYSPKWVKGEVTNPRQCIFWATTNTEGFLHPHDTAFRRRFWPIHMKKRVDFEKLELIREEVWAEAVAAFRAQETWWFENEAESDGGRKDNLADDPWSDAILAHIRSLPPPKRGQTSRFVLTAELCWALTGRAGGVPTDAEYKSVTQVMRTLGCRPGNRKGRGWIIPTLSAMAGPAQIVSIEVRRQQEARDETAQGCQGPRAKKPQRVE